MILFPNMVSFQTGSLDKCGLFPNELSFLIPTVLSQCDVFPNVVTSRRWPLSTCDLFPNVVFFHMRSRSDGSVFAYHITPLLFIDFVSFLLFCYVLSLIRSFCCTKRVQFWEKMCPTYRHKQLTQQMFFNN